MRQPLKLTIFLRGGYEISPADPHPARGDGWRRAVVMRARACVRARDSAPANLVFDVSCGNKKRKHGTSHFGEHVGVGGELHLRSTRATRLEMCAGVPAPRVFVG